MAKKMTMMERRQQLIDDRAARLARDAAKQGITPQELLKKKKDTYINVVGGAALSALPLGALAGTAAKLYKGIMAGRKAAPAAKTTVQAASKPAASTTSKSATRLSKADKAAQTAKGKPSVVKPVSPSTLQTMSPAQRKAVQALQRANAKPLTRNQAGRAQAQARRASKPTMTTQQRKATAALNATRSAPKAPPSRPKITTQPPKKSTKPITRKQAAAIGTGTTAMLGAALLGNKGQKKSKAAIPTPKPRPKTKEGGPGRKFAKPSEGVDPRGNQIKPTPGKVVMPKKFQGSYNKDTHKLSNITIDGKKSTYVLPKNMTSSKAKSLLTSTAKKYEGGGSINSGKVARQVKGWGAARKPKK